MKNFIIISILFLTAISAQAKRRILDCNITSGIHQNVSVEEENGKLTLVELDNTGSLHSRSLSNAEYKSGILKLVKDTTDYSCTLTKKGNSWLYDYSFDEEGDIGAHEIASCR